MPDLRRDWLFCSLRAGVALFLLSLGNWFGAETGYVTGWGAYWLGMNYPIRFVLFGGALLALCYGAQHALRQRQLFTVSKAMGLIYLFIALWILSIFGNYDLDSWSSIAQRQLLPWGLLFAVAAGICIYISLKTDDGMLRGFGLTFGDQPLYPFLRVLLGWHAQSRIFPDPRSLAGGNWPLCGAHLACGKGNP